MKEIKTFSWLKTWHIALAVIIAVVIGVGLGVYQRQNQNKPSQTPKVILSTGKLNVTSAPSAKLNDSASSTDIPPSSGSASLQTQSNNPSMASSSPIQSNTNIHDPSIANNPLVQSLLTGGN